MYPTPPGRPDLDGQPEEPSDDGVGTDPLESAHSGSSGPSPSGPGGWTNGRASTPATQCVALRVKQGGRCTNPPKDWNPDFLCGYHAAEQRKGKRVKLIDGRTLEPIETPEPPEHVTDAEVVRLPRGQEVAGRCQATTYRARNKNGNPGSRHDGAQCSYAALPGHATCVRHLGSIEDAVQIAEQCLPLIGLSALGTVHRIMEFSPSEKRQLEAAEIVLNRTMPVRQAIQLSALDADERDLDAELLALGETAEMVSRRAAQTDEERQLLQLAAAQGYEGEFVDDDDEDEQIQEAM